MTHAHICAAPDCHHGAICHRFMLGSRSNEGECLAPNCPCGAFEEEK